MTLRDSSNHLTGLWPDYERCASAGRATGMLAVARVHVVW